MEDDFDRINELYLEEIYEIIHLIKASAISNQENYNRDIHGQKERRKTFGIEECGSRENRRRLHLRSMNAAPCRDAATPAQFLTARSMSACGRSPAG